MHVALFSIMGGGRGRVGLLKSDVIYRVSRVSKIGHDRTGVGIGESKIALKIGRHMSTAPNTNQF